MTSKSDGEGIVWVIVAGLCIWLAYDKWWKDPKPPTPPAPIFTPYPEGPLAELPDGSVWRMVWSRVKGPRQQRLAWVRADHSKNKEQKARETLTLYTVNCDTTGYRTLNVTDYGKDGKVLNDWNEAVFSKEFDYPPPGSVIESVVDGACLPQFDPPPKPAVSK